MLRSMTTFARTSGSSGKGDAWAVEIRSVNHRYFEFSVKLPQDFAMFEEQIRDAVRSKISRGKINVGIVQHENSKDNGELFVLDETAAKRYLNAISKLSKKFRIKGEVNLGDMISLPGVLRVEKPKRAMEEIWPALERLLMKTLLQAVSLKEKEGREITRDVSQRLKQVQAALHRVEKELKNKTQQYFEKLKARVNELLGREIEDQERLLREVAFLAEKSDVTEEMNRLKSHIQLFQERMSHSQNEIGRELDFLCQELNREINTLGVKAQSFEISQEVIFVKSEIEKIREQIQNVE